MTRVLPWLFLAGCSAYSQAHVTNAVINTAIAASAVAAQAALARARVQVDRRHDVEPREVATVACGPNSSYSLMCTVDPSACFYRTNYGVEFSCQIRDCSDGVPPRLQAWCSSD